MLCIFPINIRLHEQAYPETVNRIASETADDVAWNHYTSATSHRPTGFEHALQRINFATSTSPFPLAHASIQAENSMASSTHGPQWRSMMIVIGRGRRGGAINHGQELAKILADRGHNPNVGAELRRTVGDVTTAFILGGGQPASASFLVLEAGKK